MAIKLLAFITAVVSRSISDRGSIGNGPAIWEEKILGF